MRETVIKFGRLRDSCPTDLHTANTRFIDNLLQQPAAKMQL
jgi:hypothetical protein